MIRQLLAREVNGRAEVTPLGAALITGRKEYELRAVWNEKVGVDSIPAAWIQDGQRRTQEAMAAGTTDGGMVFYYWAQRDYGCDVEMDDDRTLWLIANEATGFVI